MLSKETAVSLPLLIGGYALLVDESAVNWRGRIRDAVVYACETQTSATLADVAAEEASDTIYRIDRVSEEILIEGLREAVGILDGFKVDFEYEGEMAPDVALNPELSRIYPFSRLSGPANVLIMPGLQSANLSAKLLRELGADTTIGPILVGMERPLQVASMTANASDLVTLAVLAASGIVR